jgi:hypothetical protein
MSGVADRTCKTLNQRCCFHHGITAPSALCFLLKFVKKSTFLFVIQYFTYSTTLHGCKIWTIKQTGYKKSKREQRYIHGTYSGIYFITSQKNKSTLKELDTDPFEGKYWSNIKNSQNNEEINPYPANVENMVSSSKWRMGFNSAFKGLKVSDIQNNFFLSTSHKTQSCITR